MEMHKIHAIQRYQADQIHLDRSSPYDGGLQSNFEKSSLKSKKVKSIQDQDHQFQDLLDEMLDSSSEH